MTGVPSGNHIIIPIRKKLALIQHFQNRRFQFQAVVRLNSLIHFDLENQYNKMIINYIKFITFALLNKSLLS